MSEAKYKHGKQICSVADFEKGNRMHFRVKFGDKFRTRHRGFLISCQYRTLLNFIRSGRVFEAERIEDAELQTTVCETEEGGSD